jgi:hypothetical protein
MVQERNYSFVTVAEAAITPVAAVDPPAQRAVWHFCFVALIVLFNLTLRAGN